MTDSRNIRLELSEDDDVGYLYLPDHPGAGTRAASARQLRLSDLCTYKGPDVLFDLDENDRLIGIEIIS